ncbi:MAG: DNA methylase N-4 [Bacteroidetes bacterium GWF2_42_66]|nr:MAG: DNA methylase N-4 [Bacteroidetes bacterium GWE2_42_39]OFY42063.1 MAG: DNA methylase N-4 [Bacteroidetes bacterium GWF2_42_66]HBL77734.1 DNA methylase N-4 [Prolixibacteraceae bacterium]HCB62863.1 DNA methylase N-4 [Bacteroidales bacterium]
MSKRAKYIDFLKQKIEVAPETGLTIDIPFIKFEDGTVLKPHQRDAINWAIKGGRRALFESFGLGKTIQQLLICWSILKVEDGKSLIVCPLGVKQEFVKDARNKLGIEIKYIKTQQEAEAAPDGSILITNYERVRDGNINPKYFTVTSLDEASVLRSYGSKTYQTFLDKFKGIKYKFVCTATPSPNKYKELIHYAGYLEVMDTGQALTRFFKRDSTQANNLTIYPHKEKEFWFWMSTWALFITKPSDLGYDDTGYDLPEMKVIYHHVKVDHSEAGADDKKQFKMFRESALGLKDAAREKRDSLDDRILKMKEIIDGDPDSHFIIWHDLEAERHAIMGVLPKKEFNSAQAFGSQDLDEREQTIIDFSEGRIKYLATKPSISGQGCNFQYHCHKAIFLGIGYEFNDFIQAVHRVHRFQQDQPVEIHIIYAESEGEILKALERKWKQHNYLVAQMTAIIKETGLSSTNVEQKLLRSLGIERNEVKGRYYTSVLNDTVLEHQQMADNSIGLIHTSIPFSNHYEYSPSYNDFGHNQNNAKFFEQMDFLTPELLRVLMPGRLAVIHVKDRILFGNATGTGMPTVDPFSDMTVFHFIKHGFQYMGRITIETDVVRENNQTYRLGWTEQCKDGSKMGVGCPEYLLLFRKLPSDTSKAYADEPVTKTKDEYTRGRWQIDARAKWNSSGNRFLSPDELRQMPIDKVNRNFSIWAQSNVYDFGLHVEVAQTLEQMDKLPATFETLKIPARTQYVWSDVNRMITLNTKQTQKKLQNHICPLQFDIVDRVIERYSNKGELVDDPFNGIGTVTYRAVKLGRYGYGTELNHEYWKDGLSYMRAIESEFSVPTLFELI